MDDQPYATPAGEHWGRSHASLLDDLSRLLERAATSSARRLLLDATLVVLVAAFQATARSLLAYGARGVGEAIGGDLGLRVQRVLIADSRLARGNASSDNLRIDFERIGVVIWGLDHGVGAEAWTRRQWLDDLNEVRNAIAHGNPPPVGLAPVDFDELAGVAIGLTRLVLAIERAVVLMLLDIGPDDDAQGE